MSSRPNQPGQVPRLSNGRNFVPSARRFLNGQDKTFFGGGQKPACLDVYAPPTAWPKTTTLLRVPRVVWLMVYIDSYTTFDTSPRDEWRRVTAAFEGAKARIQAVRPDIIVDIIPLQDYDAGGTPAEFADLNTRTGLPANSSILGFAPADALTPLYVNSSSYLGVTGIGGIIAPAMRSPYLATDFLLIKAGDPYWDFHGFSTTQDGVQHIFDHDGSYRFFAWVPYDTAIGFNNGEQGTPLEQSTIGQLGNLHAQLIGGIGPPWQLTYHDFTSIEDYLGYFEFLAPLTYADMPAYGQFVRAVIDRFVADAAAADPHWPRFAAKWYGSGALPSGESTFNGFADRAHLLMNRLQQYLVRDKLAPYGYSYEGDSSDLTADSVAQTIADHYGFTL